MRVNCGDKLEVWVAEDSPFYRLVVEEALEEIARVTDLQLELRIFERFSDIQVALKLAQRGECECPAAVLSDLHFPDSAPSELPALFEFFARYCSDIPLSYMSCNSDSLMQAQRWFDQTHAEHRPIRFLRKDTDQTTHMLVKALHAMVFEPRQQACSTHQTAHH
ncbi:MAG TPA: hypothetical protein VGE55_13645 [Limnobacter sp.]|uniref:hypothetical protein n=1 Tax=Limnobacter sp. TaxID=2003368 RepID=UPI002ED9C79B